jgi:hypothetical protein
MANGVGRIGGVIMPFVVSALAENHLYSPFLCFSILALSTCISNCFLPFDTLGK